MHKEVFVLPDCLGSSSDLKDWVATHGGVASAPILAHGGVARSPSERMGERRDWPGRRSGRNPDKQKEVNMGEPYRRRTSSKSVKRTLAKGRRAEERRSLRRSQQLAHDPTQEASSSNMPMNADQIQALMLQIKEFQ